MAQLEHPRYTDDKGRTYEVLFVHRKDAEGTLMLERGTGIIVTPIMERPEWAEGLAIALLDEHREWYLKRTGKYEEPVVFRFMDLGWVGMTEDEGSAEIFADPEVRQERLAHMLGVNRETGDIAGALADVEHAFDQERSPEEASAIEDSQAEGFTEVSKAVNE